MSKGLLKILHVHTDNDYDEVLTDGAGSLKVYLVNGGSGGTASSYGAAFPSVGTPGGGQDTHGNFAPLLFDAAGNLLIAGTLSVGAVQSNTITNAAQTTISTTAIQLLAANNSRKRLRITNLGTTVIKIILGAGTPTQTVYHLALAACGQANDGSSVSYIDDMWIGAVQAISSAVGGLLSVAELT